MNNNTLIVVRNHYKKRDTSPDLVGYLSIQEDLPSGQYEVGLYSKTSKAGNKIFNGIIRPKLKRVITSFHQKD
jgi:hypothetical protein